MKRLSVFIALLLTLLVANAEANVEESIGSAPEATAEDATLSFREISSLEEAFIDVAPAEREDGLDVGELGVDGGNRDMIVKLAREISDSEHGRIDSLLVAHQGKLLFESYYLRGRVNLPHPQASATKSYTSLALGRAIELGYLSMADLDQPLVSFLKDLDPTKFVEGAEKITLHHALTMSSGIRISDEQREEFERNPSQLVGQGEVQAYLEHSAPITAESQVFSYGGGQSNLVMQVIDAVVPGSAEDFIKNELLDKMGISNYSWHTAPSGLPEAGWRVSLTSRDMIKWGDLVNNGGKWNGEQLISEEYLAKATSGITRPTIEWIPDTYFYGYFWYQTNVTVGDKNYDAKFAWGGGTQHVVVIAELDLIVVVTAHDNDVSAMQFTADRILPAFNH